MKYCADFETTTDELDCRVWAYSIIDVSDNPSHFVYGNSMDGIMHWFEKHPGDTFYFRNLKFDGEFIIYHLLKNGWTHIEGRAKLNPYQFSTLISDKGQFYQIKMQFPSKRKELKPVTILDSLKIIPLSIEKTASAFGLPVVKLQIDYDEYREPGHKLTGDEISYIRNDVEIDARALHQMFEQNLTAMTQGANALNDFREILGGKKEFERRFPKLDYDIDADIRQAYRGGYTYLKKGREEKDVGQGIVLDVNSLYPDVMYNRALPYGKPKHFNGKYKEDKQYNLYIQAFTCRFKLKEGYLPTIQLKHNLAFVPTEYVEGSGVEDVTLILANPDLELFFEHYDVDYENIDWLGGWKFRSTTGLFKSYIDKWMKIKEQASIDNNPGLRTIAKLMMNSLYGKFGLNPNVRSKNPYLEDDVVKYRMGEPEIRDAVYIPVAVFVTSWARHKTITSAQAVYDRFIYADTDSLHLEGLEEPQGLNIHPTKLGAWKHESTFHRARFLRAKCYVEEEYDNTFHIPGMDIYGTAHFKITCAGMPPRCYPYVDWDNFYLGNTFPGKLQHKHVKGGVVLKPISYSLKS